MPLLHDRGKRIKANDKDLVYHFVLISLLIVFLVVLLPFHWRTLQSVNWQTVQLDTFFYQLHTPYFWSSILTAFFVCGLISWLYYHYRIDSIKQLEHRQKLARMILENHWYEAEETQSEGFFKDLSSKKTKQRIRHFPKMYYRMKDGLIHIHVEITLGKYQDQLLHLENKLETGLYCELVEKTLKDSYVEYVLLYDTIGNRIGIEDVVAQDQYDATQEISMEEAQAGDLIFFHSTYNAGTYVTHVAIYLEGNRFYHAGDPIGYGDLSSRYWQDHLIGARRVIHN